MKPFDKFWSTLSNILILNCDRPKVTETTALGAAYLAGLSSGFIKNTEEISKKWQSDKIFKPKLHKKEVKYLYEGWLKATITPHALTRSQMVFDGTGGPTMQ